MYNKLEETTFEVSDPLFEKYLKLYEDNPRSKVFAPLAECYRKMGRKDKSLTILREGIKNHPDYLLGYLGLAQCYFDLEQFSLAYKTLKPLIEKNRENIRLQRLFAKICENINYESEALEAYKFLLFLNPKDSEAAFNVRKLEDPILRKESFLKKEEVLQENTENEDENNWETINFQKMEILDKLAHLSQRKGDIDKASEFVELSLTINPNDLWAKERKQALSSNDSMNNLNKQKNRKSLQKIEYKLLNFLKKIKNRSQQIQSQI